jgi:hypothetical protein
VILVTHDHEGNVSVRQTGDQMGRKGAGWGGGVGLAVGLFAPPLLASVAVGAVAGGLVGKFASHRLESEIHDKIGENLPPGTVTRFRFAGDVQNVQRGMVPRLLGRSYAIEAELTVPEDGAEGVIVANADFIGGFALWVDGQRRLRHTYSLLGVETYKQTSDE